MKRQVSLTKSLKTVALIVFCCSFGVLNPSAPMLRATAQTPATTIQLRSRTLQLAINNAHAREAVYRTNASKYDTAIRNIRAVESAPLKSEADVKKILDTLKNNQINNNLVLGKGFTLAIGVSSFKAGVQAEASRLSTKVVVNQLNRKTLSISRVGGFSDLKTTLKRQFDADAATLSRVGKRLQEASERRGISRLSPPSMNRGAVSAASERMFKQAHLANSFSPDIGFTFSRARFQADMPIWTNALDAAPAQFEPITASILGGIALAALAYLIIKYAEEKADDTEEDPDTGVSQMGVCLDDVKSARDSCLDKHDGDYWAQAGCWGKWAVDEAACLLLPL
jgi:hypothetical protein